MKLPGIIYSTPTEPLGRYGSRAPQIVERTGKVEGAAIADAGRILGRSITQAGTALARGRYDAIVRKNEIIKRDTIARARIEIQSEAAMANAFLGAATSLAQAGVQYFAQMKAAEQSVKLESNTAAYELDVANAQTKLESSPQTDLNEWGDIDVTLPEGVEEQIIVEADGSTKRMVPTDAVSGQIMEAIRNRGKQNVFAGLEGEHLAKAQNRVSAIDNKNLIRLTKVNADFHNDRQAAELGAAIEAFTEQGNLAAAVNAAAEGEALGVFKPGTMDKVHRNASSRINYKDHLGALENAVTEAEVSAIKTRILDDPSMSESQTNQLMTKADNQESEIKDRTRNIDYQNISDDVIATRGDKPPTELYQEFEDKLVAAGYDEEIPAMMSSFKAKLKGVEAAMDQWNRDRLEDGIAAIEAGEQYIPPPDMPKKDLAELRKVQDAYNAGHDIKTDNILYNNLKLLAMENPNKFLQIDLRREHVGSLSKTDMDEMVELQQTLRTGDQTKVSYMRTLNAEVNSYLQQTFGRNYNKLTRERGLEVANMRYAAEALINDFERREGRQPNPQERSDMLHDLFTAKVKENYQTLFGGVRTRETRTFQQTIADDHVRAIVSELQQMPGYEITLESIMQLYNQKVRDGEI